MTDGDAQPGRPAAGGWVPVPDPTILTTEAVSRVTDQFERELGALRELLETRLSAMDRATELLSVRLTELSETLDRRSADRERNLQELIEQRLSGMDRAAVLLAEQVDNIPVEAAAARDRVRGEFAAADQALRELLGARVDGMDVATKLLASGVEKIPSDVDRAVGSLKAVLIAELQRVGDVTQEKFTAIDGTFQSNALALTAALAAQKEAAAEQNKSNTLAITKSESSTKETIGANAAQAQTANASLAAQVTDIKERVVRIESSGAGVTSALGSPYDAAVFRQAEQTARQAATRAVVSQVVAAIAVLASVISLILYIAKK